MAQPEESLGSALVVGGGPAGLMAAEVLAGGGASVTVVEHMPSVGRKLLLAGRGGLNLTHSEPIEHLLARYGPARSLLEPALLAFTPADLRAWCASLDEPTFVGSSGRVFPRSFRATPLLRAWLHRLDDLGVTIERRHRWLGWASSAEVGVGPIDARRSRFVRSDGVEVEMRSDVAVLAMGGASWPRVGSDGGWVEPVRSAGVDVSALRPSNCGVCVDWGLSFVGRWAGTPVKNVAVTVDDVTVRGDVMVTAEGLEGGPVYAVSSIVRDRIERDGHCTMTVDLQPDLTVEVLAERFARRRPKDSFATAVRRTFGLSAVAGALLREHGRAVVRTDPASVAEAVKAISFRVEAVMPISRAISSAGGIALDEVDGSFMLRKVPGVFVAGEMLDWEAPTGGYLLQASFSTAVAAARGALALLAEGPQLRR